MLTSPRLKPFLLATGICALLLLVAALFNASPTEAEIPRKTKVVLYDAGQPIGQWVALGAGQRDGDTFVFRVKHGLHTRLVRISGTFTAEQTE